MSIKASLDESLVKKAKICAEMENRSLAEQIEHWALIGKILIGNPDSTYEFVHESLLATEEVEQGLVQRYIRRTS